MLIAQLKNLIKKGCSSSVSTWTRSGSVTYRVQGVLNFRNMQHTPLLNFKVNLQAEKKGADQLL
jgi:hypothetical protein